MSVKLQTIDRTKSAFSPKRYQLSQEYLPILADVLNELHGGFLFRKILANAAKGLWRLCDFKFRIL